MKASPPPLLVSVDDLATYVGETVDQGRGEAIIRASSAYVLSCLTTDFVAADGTLEPVPFEVAQVVTEIAERKLRQPDPGLVQETAGPFSRSFSGDGNVYYLTKAQKALLGRWLKQPTGGQLWTLSTTRVDGGEVDYRPIADGGDPVPMFEPFGPGQVPI